MSAEKHVHGPAEYRFCPRCGHGLESRKLKFNEPERLVCKQCSFVFYQDPKVVAGTIFTLEDRVVLLRRDVEPALGKWVFPGGYVDRGESVPEAAVRETKEECNVDVRLLSLVGVYSYASVPSVIVVYAAEIVGGELKAADETAEARSFSRSIIPWDELAFQSTRQALEDYMRLYLEPRSW